MRLRFSLAGSLLLAVLVLAACGPMSAFQDPRRTSRPTITIGSTNFSEQVILAELYGQALEGKGYRVERRLNLGSRETVEPALETGTIDMYPEYLATMLAFVTRNADLGSPDPATTHQRLQLALRPLGIGVLDYAPAINTNGFVVTKATADRYRLTRLSDLTPVAPQLVMGGSPECPVRPFCLPGLRETYGITFRHFRPLDVGGPLTVSALESGQVDVALLFTTDPLISGRQLVLLSDDRGLQLADNVAPVVRADVLGKVPSDFSSALNAVSAKLTAAELTQLNAQVGLEGGDPRTAAAAWLKANGLDR